MSVPMVPSSVYRAQGRKPVYRDGLVLWLIDDEYAAVMRFSEAMGGIVSDATEEQIAAQDARIEAAHAEGEREWAELRRAVGRNSDDTA